MKAKHIGTLIRSRWTGRGTGAVVLSILLLGIGSFALSAGAAEAPRHITLEKSVPADTSVVQGEVKEVRLFFSGAPLMRGASVRIMDSSRKLQRSGPPAADPEDGRQVAVQVEPALAPGKYVVQWRCIADDGHVMRGDFTFEVQAY